ncbi:FAD-dependent oxidoreductase [Mycobacteriaceae bacterium NPDC060252]
MAVFGGGPAGLTVAHELAERGFTVDVYERNDALGGKCRGFARPDTGIDGRPDLPYNAGGHFFFGFYQNIGQTLRRIPIGNGRTVLDNLTTGRSKRMRVRLFSSGDDLAVDIGARSGLREVLTGAFLTNMKSVTRVISQLGLRDVATLASKIAVLCTAGEERRFGELEHRTLREVFRADSFTTSGGRRFVEEIASNLTIANGQDENARVVARVFEGAVASVLGRNGYGLKGLLAHLNNPENEAWIDPWARHLEQFGVRFHLQQTLKSLTYANGRIIGATVQDAGNREYSIDADCYVLATPQTEMASLMSDDLVAADPALGRIQRLCQLGGISVSIFLRHKLPELGTAFVIGDCNWQNGNEVLTSVWQKDLSQYGDGEAVEVVSAQITDPAFRYQAGQLYGKAGDACTSTELVAEMLAMFRQHIPNGERLFAEEAIHSWVIAGGPEDRNESLGTFNEYLFGPTRSCWQDQPSQRTAIPNLFLAGTHTRTIVGCDSMDGANESGKRAANAILEAADSSEIRADVIEWSPHPLFRLLQRWDDRRYLVGKRNLFDFVAPMTDDVQSADPVERWNARTISSIERHRA